MDISIRTIPHKQQRYNTVGDWYFLDKKLSTILVSDMKNEDYAFLVGVHELIEAWMCAKKKISEKVVNDFDEDYEYRRAMHLSLKCGCKIQEEPGFDKHAPYRLQHTFATKIEKMIAKALGVDWGKYDKTVSSL